MNQLHTQVCFDALSVLNNVQYVESVCNVCGNSHYTGNCPEMRQGTYVPDTPPQSFSRSSVPNGLVVIDSENGTSCVITSQKFAKGTRFGPLLADRSYTPIHGVQLPLIIFPTPLYKDEIAEFETLFNARNIYLDTTDESKCNWMIHVNTAQWSNEQNLICYQENDSIYYAAIQDIELGDILKVWYSPVYASRMGAKLLDPSPYDICNNILRQVSIDYGIKIDDNNVLEAATSSYAYEEVGPVTTSDKDREISLPPVGSLMKMSSPPNYHSYSSTPTSLHMFDLTPTENTFALVHRATEIAFDTDGSGLYDPCGDTSHHDLADLSSSASTSHIESSDIELASQQSAATAIGGTTTTVAEAHPTDVVKFNCKVCCRKYATKLTLEKHLRTHDMYLCITCDKIYDTRHDMEEHECFKKRNKTRPLHCNICLKLLSNSWSLTRHMKIHRNPQDDKLSNTTPSTSSSSDDNLKVDEYMNDSLDPTGLQISPNQSLPVNGFGNEQSELQLLQQNQPQQQILKPAKVPGKRLEEPMECIVCRRPFKNPNALEKHLRFTHTVYTKDVNHPVYKKYTQEARMKQNLTNNSAPIKPSIAKALASKLTKKKNNSIESTAANITAVVSNDKKDVSQSILTETAIANESSQPESSVSTDMSNTNSNNNSTNNNGAIIIFEVTELTEGNMYDTNQLLSNTNNPSNGIQIVNGTDPLPKLMPLGDKVDDVLTELETRTEMQPTIVCNGTTETNLIIPHPGASEMLVDVPKMLLLKKNKKEVTAFRTNSEDILNLDNGVILSQHDHSQHFPCDDCNRSFGKKYQLKRHQETHDTVFYACPYCDKPPVKARSSLKKHLSRDHADKIHEWKASNFLTKQILKDEVKLRELKKKYLEKKRLNGGDKYLELCRVVSEETTSNSVTSAGEGSQDSVNGVIDNNNTLKRSVGLINSDIDKCTTKKPCKKLVPIATTVNNQKMLQPQQTPRKYIANAVLATENLGFKKQQKYFNSGTVIADVQLHQQTYYSNLNAVPQNNNKPEDQEIIDNLFFEKLIGDNLLDPLHGGEYHGGDDDHSINSVNYIQETFQNSFDKIQEKLDAELEVDNEQLKWEDTLKSDDSTDEMSGKLLGIDESVMLI